MNTSTLRELFERYGRSKPSTNLYEGRIFNRLHTHDEYGEALTVECVRCGFAASGHSVHNYLCEFQDTLGAWHPICIDMDSCFKDRQ